MKTDKQLYKVFEAAPDWVFVLCAIAFAGGECFPLRHDQGS